MRSVFGATAALATFLAAWTAPAGAQYLGGVSGNAKGDVTAGCSTCCYVENKGSKAITATVVMALGASVTYTVAPGERQVFMLGSSCVTSGFGLVVNYK